MSAFVAAHIAELYLADALFRAAAYSFFGLMLVLIWRKLPPRI